MTHEATQPTLDRTPPAPPAENLQSLTLLEASALLAVHRATRDRAPISPSPYLTEALFLILARRSILAMCDDSGPSKPEGLWRAIYDPWRWRYLGVWQGVPHLENAIQGRLRSCANDESTHADRLQLWCALADAEVEGYLSHLLRRHGFDSRWALDLRCTRWDIGRDGRDSPENALLSRKPLILNPGTPFSVPAKR